MKLMTYSLILLVASALYVKAMPVDDEKIASNEGTFELSYILQMILGDPEFQMLNRFEQYKILEAMYNIVASRQSRGNSRIDGAYVESLSNAQRQLRSLYLRK